MGRDFAPGEVDDVEDVEDVDPGDDDGIVDVGIGWTEPDRPGRALDLLDRRVRAWLAHDHDGGGGDRDLVDDDEPGGEHEPRQLERAYGRPIPLWLEAHAHDFCEVLACVDADVAEDAWLGEDDTLAQLVARALQNACAYALELSDYDADDTPASDATVLVCIDVGSRRTTMTIDHADLEPLLYYHEDTLGLRPPSNKVAFAICWAFDLELEFDAASEPSEVKPRAPEISGRLPPWHPPTVDAPLPPAALQSGIAAVLAMLTAGS